jgi:hypothetical protein
MMTSKTGLTRWLAMTAVILVLLLGLQQASPEAAPAGELSRITVSFKLDQRLSGPTYGGPRWVSPPTFSFAQGGQQLTVEAKTQGVGANGNVMDINAEWTPADPEMVTITRGQKNEVTITVKREGESKLKLMAQEVTKELSIKAKAIANGSGLQVEIAQ